MGGAPKSMKSAVALHFARIITQGGLTWPDGSPGPEEPGYVLWLEAEVKHGVHIQRIQKFGIDPSRMLIPKHDSDKLKPVHINNAAHMELVHQYAMKFKPKLIVLDSMAASLPGIRENDSAGATHLTDFQGICQESGAAGLVVAHLRKAGKDGRVDVALDDIRGSSAYAAVPLSIIGLDSPNPEDPRKRLKLVDSNLSTIFPSYGVTWSDDGRGGWQITFDDDPPRKPDTRGEGQRGNRDSIREDILKLLKDGKPHWGSDINAALGLAYGQSSIQRASKEMREAGIIKVEETQRNNGRNSLWEIIGS